MSKLSWLKKGLLSNFDVYNTMLTTEIKKGENEKELMTMMKEVSAAMNTKTLTELEDQIIEYEKYKNSDILNEFLSKIKKTAQLYAFGRSLDKAPSDLTRIGDWMNNNKLEDALEVSIRDIILTDLLDYLNGVELEHKT